MSTRSEHLPELRALLDRERTIPAVPAVQQARVIARARAAVEAHGPQSHTTLVAGRASLRQRWIAGAARALGIGAAVGTTAALGTRACLESLVSARQVVASKERARMRTSPRLGADDAIAASPVEIGAPPFGALRTVRSSDEATRAELRLIRRARRAVAQGDFEVAIPLIREHAHRFKNGQLAVEREALRGKALAGLGRTEEACRRGQRLPKDIYP